MAIPGIPAVPTSGKRPPSFDEVADIGWVRRIADAANNLLKGKMNVVLSITLAANAASTTITDARISVYSALILQPMTASAAASLWEAPYVLATVQNNGSVVLTHSNTADIDKTFNLVILGA